MAVDSSFVVALEVMGTFVALNDRMEGLCQWPALFFKMAFNDSSVLQNGFVMCDCKNIAIHLLPILIFSLRGFSSRKSNTVIHLSYLKV